MHYDSEDFGDGYSNDYQRSVAWQLIERPLKDERWFAASLHRAGMYVVMCNAVRYCTVTSAVLGQDIRVVGGYPTLAEAQSYVDLHADNECDGDFSYYLFSPPADVPQAPQPAAPDEDELPF